MDAAMFPGDEERDTIKLPILFVVLKALINEHTNGVGLDLISLRGKDKVDGQWKLYALVHNVEKLAHHGYAS